MAACSRTALIWSLLRCSGTRGAPGFRRATGTAVCGGRVGSVQFTAWRERHTWVTEPALNFHTALTWTSQQRAMSSEVPEKDDEYPPLPEYTDDAQKEVFIIRVKGLPWSCTADDLLKFFSDCHIRGGVSGIHLMQNKYGRPNGQAFIEMEHEKDIAKALERDREYLGPRYIKVYEVTNSDAEAILKGTDDTPCEDGVVHLKGLPFNCTEEDVLQFFSGLDIAEGGVTFVLNNRGLSSGDAFVQFTTQEMADQALKWDRELIGHRYIKVFPSKKSEIRTQYSSSRGGGASANSVSGPAYVVHMRGLPYQATPEDIVNFFSPIRLAKILIEYGPGGRPRGEADVYFTSRQDAVAAMSKDKEHIYDRYIELFLNAP